MKLIALISGLLFTIHLQAQVGLRVAYNMNSYDQWNAVDQFIEDDNTYMPQDIEIGIHYWLRLKDYRVEFLPEIVYGMRNENALTHYTGLGRSISRQYFQFKWNTQFYLFDFKEDCNCPTFSKQGSPIMKGLFIYLAPGLSYHMHRATLGNDVTDYNNLHFLLSAGLGYDIGITDLLTLTPLVGINLHFNDKNEGLSTWNIAEETDTWNNLSLGLRAAFRFDYLNQPAWKRR